MIPQEDLLITVKRVQDMSLDSYEKASYAVVYTGIRAAWRRPSGFLQEMGGQREDIAMHMICDPIDLQNTDLVIGEADGETYEVAWCLTRHIMVLSPGVPETLFDYTEALLNLVKGDRE